MQFREGSNLTEQLNTSVINATKEAILDILKIKQ